jgi:hypothetical protein
MLPPVAGDKRARLPPPSLAESANEELYGSSGPASSKRKGQESTLWLLICFVCEIFLC